ncbi:glycosyltransferase family 2 protein [Sphingobium xenophagum]|uniref:glycosyltransferase family 2 protein n=1 Tax=Sphingobium xenophagum TaxID=121428 RepID=UPI00031F8BA9|nr:glycosyltransferase family 2 protein [Sphingobium xenophagum]QWT16928.1 glycosyltransferase family 2 protein [Sphingobium xenophagum]
MASTSLAQFFRKIADIWLTASVHLDAFRAEPQAYLTATRWRIKRKRVRARGQFAPLLSRSPTAYRLWLSRQKRQWRRPDSPSSNASIIALIDIAKIAEPKALWVTQQSLIAEGLSALMIGSPQTPDLAVAITQIDWNANPWLFPTDPGDRIATGTASAYRNAIGKGDTRIIYADDDLLIGRRRSAPYFKPDWNEELFFYQDYLTGACIMRATPADLGAVAGKKEWASALVAKLAHQERPPVHLHAMLHHRQHRPMPRLPARPLAIARDLPPISVIVPTRNRVDLLRTCLDGVAEADYPHVEVIIIDNDSDDPETLAYLAALDPARHRVLHHAGAFNYSAINNRGAGEAQGRLLCLLNNDIETTNWDWLSIMATQALRPEVGAVGARLLYPDGRIQHAGVVIGVGNAAGHAHRFLRPEEEGYFHRHSLPQFTMAVTAACLVVERDKFMAVGGLNEVDFPIAFNDVDLCLRLNQKGWQSLYEPRATLIHHESVSRGLDRDPVGAARFASELAALKRIWKTDEIYDPYHHPELSRASEQFAVAL